MSAPIGCRSERRRAKVRADGLNGVDGITVLSPCSGHG